MRKIVSRFAAAGSDKRAYSVEVVQAFRVERIGAVPAAVGPAELFTTNGLPVTRVRRGEYRVNATGVTLTSTAGNSF